MPVFILGSARSGTSTVLSLLLRFGGLQGHVEGHLWPLLPRLIGTCLSYFHAKALPLHGEAPGENSEIPLITEVGYDSIGRLLDKMFADLVVDRYRQDWVDKTPGHEMIHEAPRLRQIFPAARFIYCYRDPRENLISRLGKFPEETFEQHCIDLALCWQNWLAVRHSLEGARIDVPLARLRDDFRQTAQSILSFARGSPVHLPPDVEPLVIERRERPPAHAWTDQMEAIYQEHCGFLDELDELKSATPPNTESRHHPVVLPVIAGQSKIRLSSGIKPPESAIFTDFDERGSYLFIHPGMPGNVVSSVTFEDIHLEEETVFRCVALLPNSRSAPVRFGLELRSSLSNELILTSGIVVRPWEERLWRVTFNPLRQSVTVMLSSEMAQPDSTNSSAWAKLLRPSFLVSSD